MRAGNILDCEGFGYFSDAYNSVKKTSSGIANYALSCNDSKIE
jgi:hypothetical protein